MLNFAPLNQPESLSRMAYDAIRSSILSGEMNTDEIYNEMKIAKNLGISRTPVREALLELSSQGLVTFLPRKGLVVNKFNARDIDEIFEIREAIELATVEKLCKNNPSIKLDALDKILDSQRNAAADVNHGEFVELDREFHMVLCSLTDNRRFESIMKNIRDFIHLMGLRAVAMEGRMVEVIREHEVVLNAIRQGRPMEARVLMDYHLKLSKEAVEETYQHSSEDQYRQ